MRHWGQLDSEALDAKIEARIIITRLYPYIRPYWRLLLGGFIAMIIVTATGLAVPWLEGMAIDEFIANQDSQGLLGVFIVYIGVQLVAWLGTYYQTWLVALAGQSIIFQIRQQLFAHLQKLSFSFYDRTETGRLMSRVTNDVNSLSELVSSGILNVFNDGLLLAGIMIIMISINWQLALVTFSTLPFMVLLATKFRWRMQRAHHQVRRKIAAVNANLQESIAGVKVTQSFNREGANARSFNTTNEENMSANMQAAQLTSAFGPLVELVAVVGVALVLWFGGVQVRNNALEIGMVWAFLRYTSRFFMPIRDLSQIYNIWQSASVSSQRIFELLDRKPDVEDSPGATTLAEIKGHVQFEDVTFGYDKDQIVLKDINFTANPGQTIALVGPTGAGKTSITNLLARFYDPLGGRILIDGSDIALVTQRSLHRQLGVVLQDTFLFSGTVADNIRFGKPDVSTEEVHDAARIVGAHEFILKLPEGYQTQVQERGSRLSIGQRQLISFARALLVDPKILILDEATSSVDAYTELLIQRALEKLLHGRTAFIIAHRLSTIRKADQILVIDQGQISERGTHQQLLDQGGLYYNLYQMQFKHQESGGEQPGGPKI